MEDSEHKDVSDPTYSWADFKLQLAGGRLRWFASILAVANAGLFVYLITEGDKAEIDFPVVITGQATLWATGVTFVILAAIAAVNWKNWIRRMKNNA